MQFKAQLVGISPPAQKHQQLVGISPSVPEAAGGDFTTSSTSISTSSSSGFHMQFKAQLVAHVFIKASAIIAPCVQATEQDEVSLLKCCPNIFLAGRETKVRNFNFLNNSSCSGFHVQLLCQLPGKLGLDVQLLFNFRMSAIGKVGRDSTSR